MRVYPRARTVKNIQPLGDGAVDRIIDAKESGLSKAEAAGACLAGSDDVQGFERLWRRIDRQARRARSVAAGDYMTAGEYRSAVSAVAPLLDSTKWLDGLKAEAGVATFSDLKTLKEEV